MSSKEITQYEAASLDEKMRYVQTISSAGSLIPTGLHDKGQPSPGKVLLVMETGAMLGIHPIAALGGVHIIEGKPSISPGLMSGLVRKAGHKLRVETTGTIKAGDFAATASLTRADDADFTFSATWTMDRAQRAGLANKAVWKNYGEAMCKARAISEVVREGAEDVLMGVSYTPEEMGALVTDGGEMIATVDKPAAATDWAAQISATDDKGTLASLAQKIRAESEMTPDLRDLVMQHASTLTKDSRVAAEPARADPPAAAEEVIEGELVDDEPAAPTTTAPSPAPAAAPAEPDPFATDDTVFGGPES